MQTSLIVKSYMQIASPALTLQMPPARFAICKVTNILGRLSLGFLRMLRICLPPQASQPPNSARYLVFLSPNTGTTEAHKGVSEELRCMECQPVAVQGNVANLDDVNIAISQSPRKIGGVIQLALEFEGKEPQQFPVRLSLSLSYKLTRYHRYHRTQYCTTCSTRTGNAL